MPRFRDVRIPEPIRRQDPLTWPTRRSLSLSLQLPPLQTGLPFSTAVTQQTRTRINLQHGSAAQIRATFSPASCCRYRSKDPQTAYYISPSPRGSSIAPLRPCAGLRASLETCSWLPMVWYTSLGRRLSPTTRNGRGRRDEMFRSRVTDR